MPFPRCWCCKKSIIWRHLHQGWALQCPSLQICFRHYGWDQQKGTDIPPLWHPTVPHTVAATLYFMSANMTIKNECASWGESVNVTVNFIVGVVHCFITAGEVAGAKVRWRWMQLICEFHRAFGWRLQGEVSRWHQLQHKSNKVTWRCNPWFVNHLQEDWIQRHAGFSPHDDSNFEYGCLRWCERGGQRQMADWLYCAARI